MQTQQEAMDVDDGRSCLSLGFEYEYRYAEYEYDYLFSSPFWRLSSTHPLCGWYVTPWLIFPHSAFRIPHSEFRIFNPPCPL